MGKIHLVVSHLMYENHSLDCFNFISQMSDGNVIHRTLLKSMLQTTLMCKLKSSNGFYHHYLTGECCFRVAHLWVDNKPVTLSTIPTVLDNKSIHLENAVLIESNAQSIQVVGYLTLLRVTNTKLVNFDVSHAHLNGQVVENMPVTYSFTL